MKLGTPEAIFKDVKRIKRERLKTRTSSFAGHEGASNHLDRSVELAVLER
jgi:hypothetical protein